MYVDETDEKEFQQAWHQVASYFTQYRGALGSCLHKTDNGVWLAYSRWPDKATRDASWNTDGAPLADLPDDIKSAILKMKSCTNNALKLPEIHMQVIDDLLHKKKNE